ncbi:MAG: hypothetical protein JJ831_08145 [Prochlorococcus marinus XMU1422]|nr:hypothetical protein [Prochlorococcus marinus XMU1421]MBO7013271.1 hypothetical protein [Prochlorococcus marinus XMU1422]MCR8542274.1 hypothetical protein [Prochlorococcus marinus XMU1423]
MKIAFLFSGQLRSIPLNLFRKSLLNLTKDCDYDIYAYLWNEQGKSLNHAQYQKKIFQKDKTSDLITKLFSGFKIKNIEYDSFEIFKKKLKKEYKKIFKSKDYDFATVNAIPQIYTIAKSFNLINNLDDYDLIFRCRLDSLYVHPLKLYDLEEIKRSNNLYSLNFGRAYFPERVYDIFFGGSKDSMIFLADIWEKLPYLVENEFDNRLDKRDACRLLYLAANEYDINVQSFETRICDVFRDFKNNFYEYYLISMHLISFKNFRSFNSLPFFYKWFKERNLKSFQIFFCVLKALFLSPFSYLKRLKKFTRFKYR